MIAVQLPTLLCMHLLFLRNNSGNNGWPLFIGGKCFFHVVLAENVKSALKIQIPVFLSLSKKHLLWHEV